MCHALAGMPCTGGPHLYPIGIQTEALHRPQCVGRLWDCKMDEYGVGWQWCAVIQDQIG